MKSSDGPIAILAIFISIFAVGCLPHRDVAPLRLYHVASRRQCQQRVAPKLHCVSPSVHHTAVGQTFWGAKSLVGGCSPPADHHLQSRALVCQCVSVSPSSAIPPSGRSVSSSSWGFALPALLHRRQRHFAAACNSDNQCHSPDAAIPVPFAIKADYQNGSAAYPTR